MQASDDIRWIHPRWKVLWSMAAVLALIGMTLIVMIPIFEGIIAEATASKPETAADNEVFLQGLYRILVYASSLSLWGAYTYYRLGRFSIGISAKHICIRAGGTLLECVAAEEVMWSDTVMIVGNTVVHGLRTSQAQGLVVFDRDFIREQLKPLLKPHNRLGMFRMAATLLRRLDNQALFMTYVILSVTMIFAWIEFLK